jgi:hypothetical protein
MWFDNVGQLEKIQKGELDFRTLMLSEENKYRPLFTAL